ncbi:hypothetical protein FBUS_02473 [Fasciolopsis buskii]|uniref:Voltage-dependent calcium channel alpha-2/delta subunit conserved region domain-containing protein n=1 Tax=Fasciolopsis buskii TaxID=27845 RepID=A0A8E0VMW9_9TREM|nr:hypothetical protein FBUS_02473 [Fasciolopsis buski]
MTMPVYKAPQNDVVMAVVGLQLTHSQLKAIFDRLTNSCVTETCQPCGSLNVHCYVINQAALVLVSSKGEKEVGQSLKEINCALTEAMVNQSALTQYYLYDFQGICIEVKRDVISMASRLMAVSSRFRVCFEYVNHV